MNEHPKSLIGKISKAQAVHYLTERYEWLCDRFPITRSDIPLDLYIRRNWRVVVRNALEREP